MNNFELNTLKDAQGLSDAQRETVNDLVNVYSHVSKRNAVLDSYYDGSIYVPELGLTIDRSDFITARAAIACYWPEKVVDALADRIRLRSVSDSTDDGLAAAIVDANNLVGQYDGFLLSKLKHGVMFATVGARGWKQPPLVRFHSAKTAVATPPDDMAYGGIGAGLAIARWGKLDSSLDERVPVAVNLYERDVTTVLVRDSTGWKVDYSTRSAGVPMMFAFVHKRTGEKPFGKSRITKFVQGLTQSAVRVLWDAEVSAALYAMPKDAIMGLSDDQFDAMLSNKQKAYLDSMLLSTTNDDGGTPTLQRLTANSPEVYRTQLNMLGAQLSGATGTPLNSLGIVQDNPTSAEAIQASREDICLIAENDIQADRESLRAMLRCAAAVARNTTLDGLGNAERDIRTAYAEPMLNSRAAMADFAVKFAAVRDGFGNTRTCARMCGFDEDSIYEMESEERRGRATAMVDRLMMVDEEDDNV